MSAFHDIIIAGASGQQGYQISRSVRLRSSASAYFNRTPASATNQKTLTWSGWVKRGSLGTTQILLGTADSTSFTYNVSAFGFIGSTDILRFISTSNTGGSILQFDTTAVFRDPSAWYHVVLYVDTTQATNSNGIRIYVNGVNQAGTYTAYAQNTNTFYNSTIAQYIGRYSSIAPASYFDGYLTEVNFIDGQALTPSSFGETDVITGVWKPKKYAGTYGTNGFYLNFSDNSNNTAATIGKDYSGNGNNWTPNNISVTSGVTYDSMLDVPTQWADGGNGRGNYAVWNPVEPNAALGGAIVDGNLLGYPANTAGTGQLKATINFPTSGKFYFEVTPTVITSATTIIGILRSTIAVGTAPASSGDMYAYQSDGNKWNGSATTSYGATYTTNDVIGVAFDIDAGTITFYKNGSTQGQAYSGISGEYVAAVRDGTTGGVTQYAVNFGQRPFAYTPPTGFKALNTQNLPESTIKKGNLWFDVVTRTGTGSAASVSSLSFQPDSILTKLRNTAYNWYWADAVRGVSKTLSTDTTAAEQTPSPALYTSFDSNGYTLGTNTGSNGSTYTYVDYVWKESATAGFDIVTYTGTGANRTVAHSLGVAPSMMIVKRRSTSGSYWMVYHASLASAASKYLSLNTTDAATTDTTVWNATAPTSSVFSLGTIAATNQNAETYVAYLFAEVAGFSRFGSYTGNGSSDGPFVFCGFRPRYLMIRDTGSADWDIQDTARSPYNTSKDRLWANLSSAEVSSTYDIDFLSNGFKIRSANPDTNSNGGTKIYMAFAENPFKYALAR